jgi:UDP-N-acetyl-D-mannosaminuronate dehydrogenase
MTDSATLFQTVTQSTRNAVHGTLRDAFAFDASGLKDLLAGLQADSDLSEGDLAAADATVLLTDHYCFDYGLISAATAYLFDTRNRCRART